MTGNGNRWARERVTAMRGSYRIPVYRPAEDGIEPWLNLTQAASVVGVVLERAPQPLDEHVVEAAAATAVGCVAPKS